MTVTYTIKKGQKPTAEQLKEIEEAKKKPIEYDEDCEKLSPEMIKAFECVARQRRNNRLPLVSAEKSEEFLKEANENKMSKEMLVQCEKSIDKFKKGEKKQKLQLEYMRASMYELECQKIGELSVLKKLVKRGDSLESLLELDYTLDEIKEAGYLNKIEE